MRVIRACEVSGCGREATHELARQGGTVIGHHCLSCAEIIATVVSETNRLVGFGVPREAASKWAAAAVRDGRVRST